MARQPSTIDRLPDDIRRNLQELLRDPRVTQLDATAKINVILEEEGHPGRISKSAVNRYAVKMEEVGKKLRQSREIAQMWIGRLGAEPQGEVGKLLNEMVRALAFETTMEMSEGSMKAEPKMLKDLAIAIEKLERAASENSRREEQIRIREREAARNDAVDALSGIADANTIREFRKRYL